MNITLAEKFEADTGKQVTVGRHYYTIERVIAEGEITHSRNNIRVLH